MGRSVKKFKRHHEALIGDKVIAWDNMLDNSLARFNEFFVENLEGNLDDEVEILEPFTDHGRYIRVGGGKVFKHIFTRDSDKILSYIVKNVNTGEELEFDSETLVFKWLYKRGFSFGNKKKFEHYVDRKPIGGVYVVSRVKKSERYMAELSRGYESNQNWITDLNRTLTPKNWRLKYTYQ